MRVRFCASFVMEEGVLLVLMIFAPTPTEAYLLKYKFHFRKKNCGYSSRSALIIWSILHEFRSVNITKIKTLKRTVSITLGHTTCGTFPAHVSLIMVKWLSISSIYAYACMSLIWCRLNAVRLRGKGKLEKVDNNRGKDLATRVLRTSHDDVIKINGNIFRVAGYLCGEFTGHRWILRTKASNAELWCFLSPAPE